MRKFTLPIVCLTSLITLPGITELARVKPVILT